LKIFIKLFLNSSLSLFKISRPKTKETKEREKEKRKKRRKLKT